jgi:hypothetical protein
VGSVVERLGGDVFEVEFVNEAGRTYGLHALEAGNSCACTRKAWR